MAVIKKLVNLDMIKSHIESYPTLNHIHLNNKDPMPQP